VISGIPFLTDFMVENQNILVAFRWHLTYAHHALILFVEVLSGFSMCCRLPLVAISNVNHH
jgi:hypothetical protein